MVALAKWLRNMAARAFETLAAVPVVIIMHSYDLIGPAPLWLLILLLAVSGIIKQPEVLDRLTGGAGRNLHWGSPCSSA